jgi:probable HAF family extracellular repeat protein
MLFDTWITVNRRLGAAAVAGAVLAAAFGAHAAAAAAAPAASPYTIVDLGALAGGTSTAGGINNAGVVVGSSTLDSLHQHAVRWSAAGAITDLGTLPGGGFSYATGVNDAGQVTGASDRSSGGFGYPVRWSAAGAVQQLGDTATNRLGWGSAIDPAGRVAGGQRPADSEGSPLGILYGVDGTPTEFGPDLQVASGINGRGQVVGAPGYIWQNGVVTHLAGVDAAVAINNSGVVAGTTGTHAVRWAAGTVTDLGTLDGLQYNFARAVNDAGQIVGYADPGCQPCASPRAWLWSAGGALIPLDTLVPAGSGWQFTAASGIDDRGEIAATGVHNGVQHAVKLVPRVHVDVNFQPAGAATPPGYLADTGAAYGARNGQSYGWSGDNSVNARDRDSASSPDQRYDTFLHMQKPTSPATWELAVPNGSYLVHVVAGDPDNTDSTFRITVEGVLTGSPARGVHWFEGTVRVTVNDGRLTIGNGAGADNDKIDYVDVIGGV